MWLTRVNKTKQSRRGRRAKQFRLPLSAGSELRITLRWFRTGKARRARRQMVVQLPGKRIREVCISRQKLRRKHYATVAGFRLGSAALIIIGLSGAGFSGQHLVVQQDLQPVASHHTILRQQPAQPQTLSRSEPTGLQIDKIKLSAPVVPVGLDSHQSLQIPGPHDVGWYNQGPTPGEKGPAVLVGHVDYIHDIAVFWRLREMTAGDTFTVTRADGSTVTFRVDSVQQYGQDSFPTDTVYGPLNYAGIRLITCGGTFNHVTHHYSDNMVVFGTMVI